MSQCVPNWDLDETPTPARLCLRSHSSSTPPDVPILNYEVAELTWENGQLAMHGLGPPRVQLKSQPATAAATTWDKPRANGTLESIVNQATVAFPSSKQLDNLVPWFNPGAASATATMTMDALVPCAANNAASRQQQQDQRTATTRLVGCSTRVESCSGVRCLPEEDALGERKPARVVAGDWSGRAHSMSGSATVGRDRDRDRDSQQMTVDTCDREVGVGFTSTSMGSPENTSSGFPCTKATTGDDHDSVCHSRSLRETGDEEDKMKRSGKSSVSTKRSRAAAIHNQSERKRRDKINQRMKTLQKLVPNSSKTDKASVLDEVIDYLKQLQAQVQVMNCMKMQPAAAAAMMLPMAMQQQLQMSMMAPMGLGLGMSMGMGMGMPGVMDMNSLARSNIPGMATPPSVLHPATAAQFMPLAASWDGSGGDRGLHSAASAAAMMGDPMAAFFACQSQPMTLDAYSRMAAMYQQLAHQPPASSSKN